MKYNKLLNGLMVLCSAGLITSCSESFLEVSPKGQFMESNYYSNPNQAYAALIAAYSALAQETVNDNFASFLIPANAASDDCYCGGASASDGAQWQAMNDMNQLTPAQMPADLWKVNFVGVKQCNLLLSRIEGVPGLSNADQLRYIAEGKFLRGYYYFNLVRWFGNVPLFTSPQTTEEIYAASQASSPQVYAQIEKDLTEAIPDLPIALTDTNQTGRVTQGAAKALLGKVYLFEKKWTDAANSFKDVNGTPGSKSMYGYKLLANFGDIFDADNKFHSESIFEIQKTGTQNFNWAPFGSLFVYGNLYCLEIGPRGYTLKGDKITAPDLRSGWSFNPVTPDLHDAMIVDGKYDPRYKYTIVNLDSLVEAKQCSYNKNACYDATGYFLAKYLPYNKNTSGGTQDLNFKQDIIVIRLADTYLMEAEALVMSNTELDRAQALLDAVRARVGLLSVPVTMDAIKFERRMELATEGVRYFDLIRWGDAEKVLNNMKNGKSKNFTKGKNEVLPIPLAEMTNTKMVQNPGY